MDQLPRLGKRELICLLLFTCNYVVSVWRGFLFLWVLGMGYVILLWHSLSLPYKFFFMHVLVTCKNEEDLIKIKALECSQDYSHYKSMGIFPDAQRQLTLQSMVGSGQISNSSKTLWLSLLPAKIKKF